MRPQSWLALSLTSVAALIAATGLSLVSPPRLSRWQTFTNKPTVLDREGQPLRVSFSDEWNLSQQIPLEQFPPFLISATLAAEDNDFYQHGGVNWRARLSALWLNLRSRRILRGASTISEQSVRMLHARPRNLWSKWLEGWEAEWLERRNSKNEILFFYLNQIPFAANRRGLVQAAAYFFDRELSTLNKKEMLALAVMIRSPSRLYQSNARNMESSILRLAQRLHQTGQLDDSEVREIQATSLQFSHRHLALEAPHFVAFAEQRAQHLHRDLKRPLETFLDPGLQEFAQRLVNESLRNDREHELNNAAVILVDHQSDEVLAWVVGSGPHSQATAYNSSLTPRQPGSSLKPFLYTMAFEAGFAPESKIEDSPLVQAVGSGMHSFRNYSRTHYGWITMREALANSLNIPAVRLLEHLGVDAFLNKLRQLGLTSLTQNADHYGEGLALGNGEVPLWQMVQAYSALARNGISRPLRVLRDETRGPELRVFQANAALQTAKILSDPYARRLEFGRGGTMEFPVPTAVKTGTSTDFRDAWAFAYNYKFVIGVWMGNLDNKPTRGLTGSAAPMIVARALMNQALIGQQTQPLAKVQATDTPAKSLAFEASELRITQPSEGTNLALDPRLPPAAQAYNLKVEGFSRDAPVKWFANDVFIGESRNGELLWPVTRGTHSIRAVQNSVNHLRESHRTVFVR